MSIKAMNWAWEQNCKSAGQKLVLLALADHANDNGVCWPGQSGLAAKVGMSVRGVRNAIAWLVKSDIIVSERQVDESGMAKGNRYTLKLPVDRQSEQKNCRKLPVLLTRTVKEPPLMGFDKFWEAYPRKKSKGQAEKAWRKINPDEQLCQSIMEGLDQATRSDQWTKDGGRYIPFPATWLNAKGWEDEHDDHDPIGPIL